MVERPRTQDPGRIIAHRGASRVAPENTLAAFRAAAAQGAGWIEFDTALLGDGTAVVFHDATLDRCTNATGPLTAVGRADLAGIRVGARLGAGFVDQPLPMLDAALDLIEELGISANLELKTHRDRPEHRAGKLAEAVAATLALRPWAGTRIVTSSFDQDELAAFRALAPEAPVALLVEAPPADWHARLTALRAEALHVDHVHVDRTLLAEAHARGMRVRVYTVNDPAAMEPLRTEGLTGVITDHPPLFLDDPGWADWARD